MPSQKTVEAPAFEDIKRETGFNTRDGIKTLWEVLNEEARSRRVGVRVAQEESIRKTHRPDPAPTSDQHNYDTTGSPNVLFTGSTSFNLTGLRNGVQGQMRLIHNIGTGTVTLKHESASSDAGNRFDTAADADVSVTTGKSVMVRYFDSRWRQMVWA